MAFYQIYSYTYSLLVSFAVELSTTLVYNSVFVKVMILYIYIFFVIIYIYIYNFKKIKQVYFTKN